MSVIVITRIPGLPGETYDQIAGSLQDQLTAAPGFVAHAGSASSEGVTVTEIWDQESDWRRFFEANVQPNLPPGLPAPEVVAVRKLMLA